MSILKVARLGHPVLRQVARKLSVTEIRSSEIARLTQDMVDTMHEYGGIGLAAPQVHHSVQLAIIEMTVEQQRYPGQKEQPLSIFFNPEILVLDPTEQAHWEGCLSLPDLRGLVHRPRRVEVRYQDSTGEAHSFIAEEFLATVVQHEFDHLNGKLFVDRMKDMTQFSFIDEYRKYWLQK